MSRARGAENFAGQHHAEHPGREEFKEVQRNHEAGNRIGVKKVAENYVQLHPQTWATRIHHMAQEALGTGRMNEMSVAP